MTFCPFWESNLEQKFDFGMEKWRKIKILAFFEMSKRLIFNPISLKFIKTQLLLATKNWLKLFRILSNVGNIKFFCNDKSKCVFVLRVCLKRNYNFFVVLLLMLPPSPPCDHLTLQSCCWLQNTPYLLSMMIVIRL